MFDDIPFWISGLFTMFRAFIEIIDIFNIQVIRWRRWFRGMRWGRRFFWGKFSVLNVDMLGKT